MGSLVAFEGIGRRLVNQEAKQATQQGKPGQQITTSPALREVSAAMLTEYIRAAMHKARYELMEDGSFFAVIPPCAGLWVDGDTLEGAREQLRDVLEDWILIKARHGDVFPLIAGVMDQNIPSDRQLNSFK